MSEIDEMIIETEESPEIIQDEPTDEKNELLSLRAELEALRAELRSRDELDRANSRMQAELLEFQDYFPEVEIKEIPDDIWQKVKGGASLSASFALHLRKSELEQRRINDFNNKNRKMSAGSLAQGEEEKYFSPAEVRRMTPAQVKSNYDDIINSMRHWN